MGLSVEQIGLLGDAAGLIGRHGRELSVFELETLGEVSLRVCRGGRETPVTDAEWQVVDDAIAAMKRADLRASETVSQAQGSQHGR